MAAPDNAGSRGPAALAGEGGHDEAGHDGLETGTGPVLPPEPASPTEPVSPTELNAWRRGFTPQAEIWNGRLAMLGLSVGLTVLLIARLAAR